MDNSNISIEDSWNKNLNHSFSSSKVLLIEPHVQGHHGPYLQWIVQGLVEHGLSVILLTFLESTRHPSLRQISRDFAGVVDVVAIENGINNKNKYIRGLPRLVCDEVSYWWMFRKWYRQQASKSNLSAVFLPYIDYCLYVIGFLGSPFDRTPWAGITMRPSFHHLEMNIPSPRPALCRFKRAMFLRLLKNNHLKQVLTIDESLVQYLRLLNPSEKMVSFLLQPSTLGLSATPTSFELKNKYKEKSNRKTILLYGVLTFRKGIKELLRAMSKPSFPNFVDVVLAGKITEEIRPFLCEDEVKTLQKDQRIAVLDRFISEEEERVLFEIADIVWLGYRGHYTSSGVLVQAARAGRPVIACEEGIIGWQTKHYDLGIVVRLTDMDSVIKGIQMLANDRDKCSFYGQNGQRAFSRNDMQVAMKLVADVLGADSPEVAP